MDLDTPDDVAATERRQQYQRTARDVALVRATIAACQEATKHWFCCPVTIRIDIDEVLKGFP